MDTIKRVKSVNNPTQVELICEDLMGWGWRFVVTKEDYKRYVNGTPIQNAFPYLSNSDREIIISGMTPEMWDYAFPEED